MENLQITSAWPSIRPVDLQRAPTQRYITHQSSSGKMVPFHRYLKLPMAMQLFLFGGFLKWGTPENNGFNIKQVNLKFGWFEVSLFQIFQNTSIVSQLPASDVEPSDAATGVQIQELEEGPGVPHIQTSTKRQSLVAGFNLKNVWSVGISFCSRLWVSWLWFGDITVRSDLNHVFLHILVLHIVRTPWGIKLYVID